MTRLANLIFMHFWSFLALVAGVSSWLLWCVVVGPPQNPLWHALAPIALAAASRLAATACETERHRAPILSRVGTLTLAVGFTAFVAAIAVTGLGVLVAIARVVAPPASAGAMLGAAPALGAGFFASAAPLLIGAVGLVMSYGYLLGHRRLRIRERTLTLPGVDGAFEGFRIVHLSDLHLGPLAHRGALRAAFARVSALEADLVCITGDIVDSPHSDLESWIPELRALSARHGVVAILGNHDHDSDAEAVAEAIERLTDVQLLRDDTFVCRVADRELHVVGLEDRREPHTTTALADLAAAVPDGAPHLLLAHRPSVFESAITARIPLTLAGHTHGGQLAIPGLRHLNVAHLLVSARDVGWFRSEGYRLHVSAGLGVSGQRVRVGVPRDVTVVRLTRADAADESPSTRP